jgi:hypothetical protein
MRVSTHVCVPQDVKGKSESGSWVVDLKNGSGSVQESKDKADCIIAISDRSVSERVCGSVWVCAFAYCLESRSTNSHSHYLLPLSLSHLHSLTIFYLSLSHYHTQRLRGAHGRKTQPHASIHAGACDVCVVCVLVRVTHLLLRALILTHSLTFTHSRAGQDQDQGKHDAGAEGACVYVCVCVYVMTRIFVVCCSLPPLWVCLCVHLGFLSNSLSTAPTAHQAPGGALIDRDSFYHVVGSRLV